MDSIIEYYNTHRTKLNLELEIRYKNVSCATILQLLKDIKNSDKEYTITSFIDVIKYTKDYKTGTRTFFTNSVVTTIPYEKKSLCHATGISSFGKFSYNISEENPIDLKIAKLSSDKILFKHRVSTIADKNTKWRIDITITNESDSSSQAVRKNKEQFKTVTTIDHIINEIVPHKYTCSLEIERISNDTDVTKTELEGLVNIIGAGSNHNMIVGKIIKSVAKVLEPNDMYLQNRYASAHTLKQLLPHPSNLTLQSYANIFPPVDYMLTDKADGYRALLYSDGVESAYLIYAGKQIKDLGFKTHPLILDCEFIEDKNLCLIFDVILADKMNHAGLGHGLEERIKSMPRVEQYLKKFEAEGSIRFQAKKYVPLTAQDRYRQNFTDMYNKNSYEYKLDGLILTHKNQPYSTTKTYKWKPIENQTIDFYCRKCPNALYGDLYKQKEGYDLYFLYTGINTQLKVNMRLVEHSGFDLVFQRNELFPAGVLPIQFTTPFTPLSFLYYKKKDAQDLHDKIVELKCTGSCIVDENIMDWEFVGIRHDKIMIPGREYGNYYLTAYDTLLNYMEPFPIEYLLNSNLIYENVYFISNKPSIYNAQTSMLNYVKSVLISEYAHKAKTVLDLGSGRGADIYKYIQNNVDSLVVTDVNKPAITELLRRWITTAKSYKTEVHTELTAAVIDFNELASMNVLKLKNVVGGIGNVLFNAIFANLSVQYACISTEAIRNFITLCKLVSEKDTTISFVVPMGDQIFKLLGNNSEWNANQDGYPKYSIKKLYTETTLTEAGQMIEVLLPFSHQQYYKEPLFNLSTWKELFEDNGMSLVKTASCLDYLEGFRATNKKKYQELTEDDKLYIGLYGVVVFKVN